MSEQQPLLQSESDAEDGGTSREIRKGWRQRTAEKLETKSFHMVVIGLISIDSIIVLADLSYSFLSDSCSPEAGETPLWLEMLSDISLGITILFVIELLLCTWAFGPRYYSPFQSVLHFCDGSVIIMTFVVDVVLKGRERELAALLILLRLVRFAGEAAVGVAELNEGTSHELHEARRMLAEKTKALYDAQQEIQTLKLRFSESTDGA
ncbi:hypothetical protein JB92DRAFT_3015431 [Gautieria morchelliformis]|nr:hypothetical protein JB92DRAFT_3015431 [Gautieria morchelliformis]